MQRILKDRKEKQKDEILLQKQNAHLDTHIAFVTRESSSIILKTFLGILQNKNILYYLAYMVITILGIVWDKIFFGFLLIDIVTK